MIRRLRLTNWRAYDNLDLTFGPGTTFIVAPNGVGKTSLIEAAAWALFGQDARPTHEPVRAGAKVATASVDVELPDGHLLSVERPLPAVRTRTDPEPSVLLDGKPTPAVSLASILRGAYGADPTFLARVVMPTSASNASFTIDGPDLTQHLCELFGVSGLTQAADELESRMKANDRTIKAAKEGNSITRSRLSELEQTAAAADAAATIATQTHEGARAALAAAREQERLREDLVAWERRAAIRQNALTLVAEQASALLGMPIQPDTVRAELIRADQSVREALDASARVRGAIEGTTTALQSSLAELDGAHADCPVCRRPLDSGTVLSARDAHTQDLARLAERAREAASEEALLAARQNEIRLLTASAEQAPAPGPRPAFRSVTEEFDRPVDDSISDEDPSIDGAARLRDAETLALEALVSARVDRNSARTALEAAAANGRAHTELVALYRRDALLKVAKLTVDQSVREFMDQTIQPLAREIGPRWSALFPGRGPVHVDGGGALSRVSGGLTLPLEAFSGGERTGALVLLRLLITQMTTRATFCWFDEPLEHLDPDTRRQAASLLAGAGSSLPLRQVVLTTYEEPLAARLAADNPNGVHLVTVRSAA